MQVISVFPKNPLHKKRKETTHIILHHAKAINCTVQDIDAWHKSNGWLGIGYNFFISKVGLIYEGRPIDCEGAHTIGYNDKSVGICFEGDFTVEQMPQAQKTAIVDLVNWLKIFYPNAIVGTHKDYYKTECPGKYFDYSIIEELNKKAEEPKEECKSADIQKRLNKLEIAYKRLKRMLSKKG